MKITRAALIILIVGTILFLLTPVHAQLNCSGGQCFPMYAPSGVAYSLISDPTTYLGQGSVAGRMRITSTGDTALEINGSATGNPFMDWRQNGTERAYFQYADGGPLTLALNAGGSYNFATTGLTVVGLPVTAGLTSTTTIATAAFQMRGNAVLLDGLPTCSGAGCVMGAASTNTAMNFTTTTTGASDITVTFSTPFAHTPSCFSNNETTGNISRVTTVAAGSIHVQGVTVAGDTLRVGCFGN